MDSVLRNWRWTAEQGGGSTAETCSLCCRGLPRSRVSHIEQPQRQVSILCVQTFSLYTTLWLARRLLAVAAQALGVAGAGPQEKAGEHGSHARRRMRELSMAVHPDKCSLAGAEQVSSLTHRLTPPLQPFPCQGA